MKKSFKKFGVIVLALAMVFALTIPAMAAGNTPTSGSDPAKEVTAAATVEVSIAKNIVLFNVDGSSILEPNVTYSYSATPATVATGTTITGKDSADDTKTVTVSVNSGVANGVLIKGNGTGAEYGTAASVVFGEDNTTKIATYKETDTVDATSAKFASKNLTIKIDANAIYNSGANKAGVYRYVLTDTTNETDLLAAGIKRDTNYNETLYLDVYTKYNDARNGLLVYGYVLFKTTANQSFEYDETLTSETIKVTGFDVKSETGESGSYEGTGIISDQYHTYNVEVKKNITGAVADVNHQFPFKVEITNVANTISGYTQKITSKADFYYIATQNGTAGTETVVALDENGAWTLGDATTSSALKFKKDDGIVITGLPVNALVKVTEMNDTVDLYVADMKDTDNAALTLDNSATTKEMDASTGTAAMKEAFAVDNTSAKDVITVTNTLSEISVTGVTMRVAPFAAMAGAGIVFLAVSKKSKKEEEEA